ncbi:MAG: hypothetical protein KDJ15_02190 [Alphaproteobacteria bacterium]|nr:hypothetical protein [Alphaproteobacteria bacterium]
MTHTEPQPFLPEAPGLSLSPERLEGSQFMKIDRNGRKSCHRDLHEPPLYPLVYEPADNRFSGHALFPLEALVALADEAGEAPFRSAGTEERALLTAFVSLASLSPVAGTLVRAAASEGWRVGFAAIGNEGYHLDIPARVLWLDSCEMSPATLGRSVWFRNALLYSFVRALRDIGHERDGAFSEAGYRAEDMLMAERIRAADCDCVALLAAWELRGAGHPDLWRHVIGSAEGDMALAFTRTVERAPASLFGGAALAGAFRMWFTRPDRVDACDHGTLEQMDDILAENPDSSPFGRMALTPAAIEDLSLLPGGVRYLDGLGGAIKADPLFAGLNDIVNQTHFMHIMRDLSATVAGNVPFRDAGLAARIFPSSR